MTKLIYIVFLLLLTTIILLSSFSIKTKSFYSNKQITDTTDYLYSYGHYIYQREKCDNCHTLTQTISNELISLDGMKDKYPKSMHFIKLVDPQIFVSDSKMPEFLRLINNIFTKDSIEKNVSQITNEQWENEITKTIKVKNELNVSNIDIKENSEILSLIYFLDNIPTSEVLKTQRKKESDRIDNEQHILDSLWGNTDDILMIANNILNAKDGQKIFQIYCTTCHGELGQGLIGPNLTDTYWLHGGKMQNIVSTITYGIPKRGMLPWNYKLTPNEVGQLVAYINSIKNSNPPNAKEKQGKME